MLDCKVAHCMLSGPREAPNNFVMVIQVSNSMSRHGVGSRHSHDEKKGKRERRVGYGNEVSRMRCLMYTV